MGRRAFISVAMSLCWRAGVSIGWTKGMMHGRSSLSILLILLSGACVDRISFDTGTSSAFAVVVDGYISDRPGPYQIQLSKAFDIESKSSFKTDISAKQVIISDDRGNSEILTEVSQGVYQTSASGIRGTVGSVYKLSIELLDGRVYESYPDTLLAPGSVDSVYYDFVSDKTSGGATTYGFDVLFNSSAGRESNYRFLWKFTGTFRAETSPDLKADGCEYINGRCNFRPLCSGLLNIAVPAYPPSFIRVKPCECCTCWYDLFNPEPIISDNQLLQTGRFIGVKAYHLPLNYWIFMHKVHVEVSQMSLTHRTFDFWKAIKAQKDATNSLFQPISGKIPSHFVQISGKQGPIEGLFFATGISSKTFYISYDNVPDKRVIPSDTLVFADSCLKLFPHATTTKPSYWID